ncbi:hypothetical protein D3C81_1780710 [compost metagenome]
MPGCCLLVDETFVAQPADLPIRTDDAVFTVFDGALDQHLGQAALGIVEVVGVDAIAPLVEVGQQQPGRAPKYPFIGRADIDHLPGFPVERPQHRVDAVEQGADQLLTFAQARDLALGMQQRHQRLGSIGEGVVRGRRRSSVDHAGQRANRS